MHERGFRGVEKMKHVWINKVEEIPEFLKKYINESEEAPIIRQVVEREMTAKFSNPKWISRVASKKHHSIIDRDEEGLSRHLQNTLFVADDLLFLDFNKKKFTAYERDIIKAACLTHDYGVNVLFPHEKYNIFSKNSSERDVCNDISHLIHRHMGQWSKYKQPDCEMSYFVHQCDMIASRDNILILGTDDYGFEC